MQRRYFPLHPIAGKRYDYPKQVLYAYVDASDDNVFLSAITLYGQDIIRHNTPEEFVDYIYRLDDKAWIITYSAENWDCILGHLSRPEARIILSANNKKLDIVYQSKRFSVVDIFAFYPDHLVSLCYKVGIHLDYTDIKSRLYAIFYLWNKLVVICKDNWNCYPSKTPGATALKLWQRYLKETIRARGVPNAKFTRYAIRPPALHWKPGYYKHAYLYDMNAAYPHVMRTLRYPVNFWSFQGTPPLEEERWIATVKIDYKCDSEFSPLSVQLYQDNNVSPTEVKDLTTTLTYIDVYTLRLKGELIIKEWIEGIKWRSEDEADLFSEWADDIERLSLASDENKVVLKIISRSLHSKFAQNKIYSDIEIIAEDLPEKEYNKLLRQGKVVDILELDDGAVAYKINRKHKIDFLPFERPEWEALTLAMGRFIMYSSMNDNVIYAHTDSIISTTPRDDLYLSDKFGAWKHKEEGAAYIAGLGIYAIANKIGRAGMRISKEEARKAIMSAVLQGEAEAMLLRGGKPKVKIRKINYPLARVIGSIAYVTRSPERAIPVVKRKRILFSGGLERCILK